MNKLDIAVNTARTEIENKELATKHDIKKLEAQLQAEIHKAKFEIVVWMLGFLVVGGMVEHCLK